MENTSTSHGNIGEEIRVRKSYHAPQLMSLGEIQSIIQGSGGTGPDAPSGNTATVS